MSNLQLVAVDKKHCEASQEASYPGREISRTSLIWNLILATATFSNSIGILALCLSVIFWGVPRFFVLMGCHLGGAPFCFLGFTIFGGHLGCVPPLTFTCPTGGP